MSWPQHVMNPQYVRALYDADDGLDQLDLIEVILKCYGPGLTVRANLARFPDRPSPRWPREYNQAQVRLDFLFVTNLSISGFAAENRGRLLVEPRDGGYQFTFQGATAQASGFCTDLRVADVTGYINTELEGDTHGS